VCVAVLSTMRKIIAAFKKRKSKNILTWAAVTGALDHSAAYELYEMITGRTTSPRNCAE